MANEEHLTILKQGVDAWNNWRKEHSEIRPDLRGIDFSFADLSLVDLSRAILYSANFSKADLSFSDLSEASLAYANFNGATLTEAEISGADLMYCSFIHADLCKASLSAADLFAADLSYADLSDANLSGASLLRTNLKGSILSRCSIFGISVWKVQLEGAIQDNLVLTPEDEPTITVDNLEVAQFIYLLLNNKEIRNVIDTITSKVVLILGRFTPKRKAILDALREELRKHNYTPVLFDFERPVNRDFTETVRTLAHLARFIITDLTDPSSIPQELQAIVPDLEVPVQPVLQESKREYAMFVDFRKYHWVLPVYLYKDQTSLIVSFQKKIIEPADKKAKELALEKAKRLERP